MTHLAAFFAVSALVIVTPGQDTALTIRNALLGGRRGGVFTAGGVASGQAVWTVAASAGVAALLRASEPAFLAVRLAGGSARRAFRQGLLSNLGNPKMAVFFMSLLPQFATRFSAGLVLGLVFCSMTFVWLTGYAFAVAKAGGVLRRPRVRRALDRVTGAVLVAFGLRLAAESR